MGAVHFSLDVNLVAALRRVLPLETLVETGTFQGDTVAQMLPHFREIHTVEWSPELHAHAAARFQDQPNVHCANDTSPAWLRRWQPSLASKSVLYWLDAHWCNAADTAGQDAQCPLLEELDAIAPLNDVSAVLIDDARLFLSTPPNLHRCDQWPRFHSVVERLLGLGACHELTVVNDVIVFCPAAARSALQEYGQASGVDWLAIVQTARQPTAQIDYLKAQVAKLSADHLTLSHNYAALLEQARAMSHRIAELDAQCVEMRKPSYPIKVLCRRIAALLGTQTSTSAHGEPNRRAA